MQVKDLRAALKGVRYYRGVYIGKNCGVTKVEVDKYGDLHLYTDNPCVDEVLIDGVKYVRYVSDEVILDDENGVTLD